MMRRWWLAALSCALLAGCGVAYVSPEVGSGATDSELRVVPITATTLAEANATPYTPRRLPAAFGALAGSGAGMPRATAALPAPAVPPEPMPTAAVTRLPPPVPQAPYRLGVGDVVVVTGLSGGSLAGETPGDPRRVRYTVQDDGAIAVPGAGRVRVAGRTIGEAEEELLQALVAAGLDSTASLDVAEFRAHRATVGGAVGQAAVVAIGLTRPTLEEALAAAGGISVPDRDFAVIRIFRQGRLYAIPLSEYDRNAEYRSLPVIAGDSIFVDTGYDLDRAQAYFEEQIRLSGLRSEARARALAELETEIRLRRAALDEARQLFRARVDLDAVDRDYVYLAGEVANQGRFPLPFGRQATLADALFGQGGAPTETANPAQIYVLRAEQADLGRITAWHLDARNAVNLVLATRFELRPDDVVFVAEQPITRWHRLLKQFIPALITSGVSAASI